jgi:protein transport protein SEC31
VTDVEKRLNILFDHLNNGDLIKEDTIGQLVELAQALEARDFERAQSLQMEIHRDKTDECGNWMVGVKRLVGMCKATP